MPPVNPASILLIEDNQGDVVLFQTALESQAANIVLRVARSIDDGIGLLTGTGNAGVPLQPIVILLDLHMPGKDGMSFLRYRRDNPEFTHFPVIVLSSSTRQKDADECLRLEVLRYRTKPMSWPDYQTLIADLRPFWDAPIQNGQ